MRHLGGAETHGGRRAQLATHPIEQWARQQAVPIRHQDHQIFAAKLTGKLAGDVAARATLFAPQLVHEKRLGLEPGEGEYQDGGFFLVFKLMRVLQ